MKIPSEITENEETFTTEDKLEVKMGMRGEQECVQKTKQKTTIWILNEVSR